MKRAIGIDFGMTNTRLSLSGAPWRYPMTESGLLPSALAFLPNEKILIGADAIKRLPIDPQNVVLGPKRLLGARFISSLMRQFQSSNTLSLVDNRGEVAVSTRAGIKTPDELCVEVINHIITSAEVDPKTAALAMTVPVAFDERQRRALVSVCRQLGFATVRLLEEPVATAVSYLERCNLRRSAVFDLGGGTFDFAVLGYSGRRQDIEVLATGGDALGGADVDRKLAKWASKKTLAQTGWDLTNEQTVFAQVVAAAEWAKIALGQHDNVLLDLRDVDDAAPIKLPQLRIMRATLHDIALPLIQKMFRICDEVLHEAKTTPKEIDALFMSGSGSLMYGIADAVTKYFDLSVRTDIDPSFVVSIGAGITMARPRLHSLFQNY